MTEKHQLLTDNQFEQKFKNGTLPPTLVKHEAHLRLAYIHITKYGFKKAISNLLQQMTNFDEKFGNIITQTKESIISLVKLVQNSISEHATLNFSELSVKFPSLKRHFLELLNIGELKEKSTETTINHRPINGELMTFRVL